MHNSTLEHGQELSKTKKGLKEEGLKGKGSENPKEK